MDKETVIGFFFSLFPNWFIAASLLTGMIVLPLITLWLAKPLFRGLSHGLYEVVMYWKAGVSVWGVFKRFLKVFYFDLPLWGVLNSTTTSTSRGPAAWSGVFGWFFKKDFTRANSIREQKAKKEASQ